MRPSPSYFGHLLVLPSQLTVILHKCRVFVLIWWASDLETWHMHNVEHDKQNLLVYA